MDLVFFLLLLSPLILVHEFGHFLAARFFGVKVLTFSFGVGPKLLSFKPKETEYRLSLIPLGGYVRFLERGKEPMSRADHARTFEALRFSKRAAIVLAGPVMNLVFPIALYFSVFVQDTQFLAPTVGSVLPDYPAEGKLFPGDRIMAVNDEDVSTFQELRRIIGAHPRKSVRLRVFRDNQYVDVDVTPKETVRRRALDLEDRVGTIGIHPTPPAPVIAVPFGDKSGHGLATFDVLTHVAGQPVRTYGDVVRVLSENRGETVPVTYLRPVRLDGALGGLAQMAVYEAGVAALTPDPAPGTPLERVGFELADPYVGVLSNSGPLRRAGLQLGDKILRFDGHGVGSWSVFEERVRARPSGRYPLTYSRRGEARETFLDVPDIVDASAEVTSPLASMLGGGPWIPLAPEPRVKHPSPLTYAFSEAVRETVDVSRFLGVGLMRLVQGRMSLDQLSGPLTIYEVAREEREKGADYFIWLMALISINLGLLNLLPIPVLDGGALLIMSVEGVMGRALPGRARELTQVVGVVLLVLLMGVALRNDFRRGASPEATSQF